MSSRLPVISGKQLMDFLIKEKGYKKDRRKGSHCILVKEESDALEEVVVPDHKELARGTMRHILKATDCSREEITSYFRPK
jgi:predicted RNA binding protein YcfA (HicA-like mRNA interferase family)